VTEIEQLLRGIAAARREADVGNDEISCGITLAESEQLDEAADKLEALSREQQINRAVITEANNSLYGSQGYFISAVGGGVYGAVGVTGEPDKYHLATKIEELKRDANKQYNRAEALSRENAVMREALAMIAAPHSCSNNDEAIVYVQRISRAALNRKDEG